MSGFNIVIADSEVEVNKIVDDLGIISTYGIASIHEAIDGDPDAVLTLVVKDKAEANRYLSYLNAKKSIVSIDGKRKCSGTDLKWLRCSLRPASESPAPTPVREINYAHMEKTCPYREIGYV